jgi:hypothetical protein
MPCVGWLPGIHNLPIPYSLFLILYSSLFIPRSSLIPVNFFPFQALENNEALQTFNFPQLCLIT